MSSSSSSNAPWIYSSPFLGSNTTTTTSTATATGSTTTTTTTKTALIILNAPIRTPPSAVFCKLWERSSFRVCADGGANRLYQATVTIGKSERNDATNEDDDDDESNFFLPSLITGDLDSIQDHVQAYYEKHGVPIVRVHDQDCNDLDKSLQAVLMMMAQASSLSHSYDTCYIYGAFGGRFDQEMASLQALYKYAPPAKRRTRTRSEDSDNDDKTNDDDAQHQQHYIQNMWLYNDHNVAILLQPNQKHVLQFPNYDDDDDSDNADNSGSDDDKKQFVLGEGPTCGLIPLGFACENVTTTGLKWNLHQDALSFGGLVSTSNRMVADTVTIEIVDSSSHPLLFTAEIVHNTNKANGENKSAKNDVEKEVW
jgi:thiamine pyrophosphokinase